MQFHRKDFETLSYSFDEDSYQFELPTHEIVDYRNYMGEHCVADKKLD